MKSKLSMKILGVVVAFATVASLLVGITAAPVSAAAGANTWAVQNTPSAIGEVFVAGINTNQFVISPDGNTIFAWDNVNSNMYVSTNAGLSFGAPVNIAGAGNAVDMVISPNYTTDHTAVLITGDNANKANNHVWWTTNGGASWADVAPASLQSQIVNGDWITSVDIANYWSNNTLSIVIGIAGGLVGGSNVLKFTAGSFAWTPFGALTDPVYGVKFSPHHISDSEVMAVYVNGATTNLTSSIGGLPFDTTLGAVAYPAVQVIAAAVTGTVQIATASDYLANTGAPILVGTTGGANGVYRVAGRTAGSGGSAALDVATAAPIASLVVSGPLATATAYYTLVNQGAGGVWRSTTFNTPASATWAPASKITGAGAGVTTTLVALGGTYVYASTSGIGAANCAFQRSADGGADFNQISLIDVGVIANMSLVNLEDVDANTMFLIMKDTATNMNSLFKTVNGGTNWERILTGPTTMTLMSASPAYATDTTLIVCDTASAVVEETVNGGTSFLPYGVLAMPTAVKAIAGGMFYTGGAAAAFYKSGSFVAAAFPTGFAGTINSIAISPKDTTGMTIAVGTTGGQVYLSTNGGASFTQAGAGAVPAAAMIIVAYGPDGTLYAADSAAGVFMWTGTAWSAALQAGTATGLAVATSNTLYMSSNTAGVSVYRSLNPTAAPPTFQMLNSAGMGFPLATGAGSLIDEAVVSGTTANTIFGLENTVLTATTGYGYTGALIAFSDTLIVPMAITAPANNAVLASPTTATVSWPAVTGATEYMVSLDGSGYADVGNVTSFVIGSGTAPYAAALVQGSTHTWSVCVGATNTPFGIGSDLGQPSATNTFITALMAPAVTTNQTPTQGATGVDVNTTFTWPASTVAGATYQFVIAEGGDVNSAANPFAIIDYSTVVLTNATALQETLNYDTQYYWEVRTVTGTSMSAWTVSFFTTESAPVVTTPMTTAPAVTTIIVPTQPVATPTVTVINSGTGSSTPVIPSYLLWAVIAVGAILVIAVIVLIVRTRRIP